MEFRRLVLFLAWLQTGFSEECRGISRCSCVTPSYQKIDLSELKGQFFVTHENGLHGTELEYRYYPCAILSDWMGECTQSSKASICLKNTTKSFVYFSVVTTQTPLSYNITNKSPYTTDLTYGGVTVQVVCASGRETQGDTFSLVSKEELSFKLITAKACPIQLRYPSGHNPPVLFILLCLVGSIGTMGYLAFGVVYQYVAKDASGVELIPHVAFWKETPFLFRDGFLFVFCCLKSYGGESSSII